jgi:hypothetical protein
MLVGSAAAVESASFDAPELLGEVGRAARTDRANLLGDVVVAYRSVRISAMANAHFGAS